MPQATNLSLLNNAAAAKVFALASPASANQPAVWLLREGANQSVYPAVLMSSAPNGARDARKVHSTIKVPVGVVGTDGITRRIAAMEFNLTATIPDLVPDAVRDDAIAFLNSYVATALAKECHKVGFAAS